MNSYDYANNAYTLYCSAPGNYVNPPTSYYNSIWVFYGVTGTPPMTNGVVPALPAGQLFDVSIPTNQTPFTQLSEEFEASTSGGIAIGPVLWFGGAISVGRK